MDLKRIRKALTAAGTVFVATIGTGLLTEIPQTEAGWTMLVGGALVAAVAAGRLTWRVPNDDPDVST